MVWVGCYLLGLQSLPVILERGWAVGKGPLENMPIDLLLYTKSFIKLHNINLQNPYMWFNFFPKSKGLYIMGCSKSPLAQLIINGDAATQQLYYLNQYSIKILLDKLKYHFQQTEFAAKDNFKEMCRYYMAHTLSGPAAANINIKILTPLPNKRIMGRQTLGDVLGAGGHRRVFFISDQLANIAVIKVVEQTS